MSARIRLVARLGGPDSPLPRYMVVSLLLHFVFVAVLVFLPSLRSRPRLLDDKLVVEMVAGLPGRPQRAAPAPPAPPAKKVAPQPVEPKRPKPQPKLQLPDPVKKALPKKPTPPAPAATEPEQPSGDSSPAAAKQPAGTSQPVGDGRTSVAAVGLEDSELAWYADSLKTALFNAWRKPMVEGLVEKVSVVVEFKILADGTVRDIQLAQSSGVPSLDRSALRAVSDAAPLPPLPRSRRASGVTVQYVFEMLAEDL